MPAATLARLVLIEARRGGLPWLALTALLLAGGLAAFLSEVALTESLNLRTAIVGAVLRACAVFLIAAYVASSTFREINDKGLELVLALPISRPAQYVGRLAGYAACATTLAAAFSVPLLLWASPAAAVLWGLSLACEAALVAAIALFFAITLAQLVPAIAATLALYILARSMPAIQLIAGGPLADPTLSGQLSRWSVDAIALLLPPVDAVTRTSWLLYELPTARDFAWALGALLVYGTLVIAAGLFDFHRRNL